MDTKKKPISDTEMAREERSIRDKLNGEKKVRVCVMPDGGDANLRISIGGAVTIIPKGTEVDVPESVYLFIRGKYVTNVIAEAKLKKEENKKL